MAYTRGITYYRCIIYSIVISSMFNAGVFLGYACFFII